MWRKSEKGEKRGQMWKRTDIIKRKVKGPNKCIKVIFKAKRMQEERIDLLQVGVSLLGRGSLFNF
jgi:hypothetical protein